MSIVVTQLNYYPIKSLSSQSLVRASVDEFGITNDRRYMLVDTEGNFVTQRKFPILSQLKLIEDDLNFYFSCSEPKLGFTLAKSNCQEPGKVEVWGDRVSAMLSREEDLQPLSNLLGLQLRLAFMDLSSFRQVDRDFFAADQRVSFADAYPFLLISEASLADLNTRLEHPVPMSRFRPNIVVSGCEPYAEDAWSRIRIGQLEFDVVKPCSRCIMTTIDEKGVTSKEPLKTLAGYRTNEHGACFGQNLVHLGQGTVSLHDCLEIIK